MKAQPTAIKEYDGLYGDRNSRPEADYLFSERLETRSPKFGWDIKPHSHPGLLQVFLIQSGDFELFLAEEQQRISAPCLLVIPSAALHGFRFNEEVKGRILTMKETLYTTLSGEIPLGPVDEGRLICISQFTNSATPDRIDELMAVIDDELVSHETGKQLMLRICLQQLFLLIRRQAENDLPGKDQLVSSVPRVYRQFHQLIRQTGAKTSVAEVAATLGVSTVHLNRICNRVAGKSAGMILQEYLIGEAKKYLSYTSYSIAEIAYRLHFDYPNYFARFFRKHTGLSPLSYRNT